MPRTSRSVAQRLASQQSKPKKRRSPRGGAPSPADAPAAEPTAAPAAPSSRSSVSVDQILDEVVPSEGGARSSATPTLAPAPNRLPSAGAAARRGRGLAAAKAPPVRRRYSEYGTEYAYVWADLRRIFVVAAVLIALLVVLSFVIQ
jgi:hypothetical protein